MNANTTVHISQASIVSQNCRATSILRTQRRWSVPSYRKSPVCAMADYKEGEFTNARGQKLFTVQYTPTGAPKAIIFFHHGYGEHVGRYTEVFTTLAKAGIAVHTYDTHSFGKSEPTDKDNRGLIQKFEHLLDDFYQHRNDVAKTYDPLPPCFSMGQSMGGLVAAQAVLKQQELWSGLIMHSALVDVEWTTVLKLQSYVGNVMASLIPRSRIVPAVDPNAMSVDPAVVKHYVEDPLNYIGNVRAKTGNELLQGFRQLAQEEANLAVPIYACHGSADTTTSLKAVQRLVDNSKSSDKTVKVIEGAKHELLLGPEREECITTIVSWIGGQVGKPKL